MSSGGPSMLVTIYMTLGIICSGNSRGTATKKAARQICIIRLVPSAPMRGLVFGKREKRALTGLFPTKAFQASGFGLAEEAGGLSRRLPCVSCCAVVVMSSRRLSKDSVRVETAVHLRLTGARLALPRAV